MTMDVYVASAFSKDNRGGNKAGVVLQRARLNEAEKTKTAFLLGYSETAFVDDSELADFKLEYFTSEGEVPLCGHATIGTFTVLRHLGMLKKQEYTIETKSGILRIRADENGLIFMEQNTPKFYEKLDKGDVEACFNPDGIADTLPVQIVSTGLRDIMVPVTDPEILGRMTPDFAASDNLNIVMAMNMGGDDFIAKPFDLDVLTAKIQALLRRTYEFAGQNRLLEHRGAVLDVDDGALYVDGNKLTLTRNEQRILQILMENKGRIISRDTLMLRLWESDSYVDDNTLTVNVTRLRKKLEQSGLSDFIQTRKGCGYLIE